MEPSSIPTMTDIIKATKLAYEEGGKLEAAWVAMGGVGAFLFTDEFSSATVKIQGLQKEIDDLEKRKRNYMGPGFLQEYLIGSDSEIDAKIAATKAQIEALTKSTQKPPAKQPGWTSGADLPTGVAGLIAGGEEAKKKAAEAATKELDAQKKLLAELAGLTSSFADDWDALNKVYGQGKISVEQLTAAQSDLLSKQPAIKAVLDEKKKAADELAKADLEAAQAHTQHINSLTGSLDALKAEVQAQQDYVDRLGLSEMAIAELDAARLEEQATALEGLAIKKLERDLDETQYALYKAQAEELRKLAKLKRAGAEKSVIVEQQQKDAEEALKIWDNFHENVQRNLGDQLYGAMSGEFDNIADAWKSMLRRMTADAMAAQLTESLFKGGKSGQGLVGDLIGAGIGLIGGVTGSSIGANASAADYDQYGVGLPVPSASRGFDIPAGVNPLTQLHEREMVLPAEHADVIRGLATQPGAGGGKQITFNYYQTNHIDSRTDRGAIEEDLLRIKDATKLEMVDELQRAGAI